MSTMAPSGTYPRGPEDLPAWFAGLPHASAVTEQLIDSDPDGDVFRVSVELAEADLAAQGTDPLVVLVGLAFAAARLEDKLTDVVRVCRTRGKSWTQIGEALGMTKQSAWSRFSGEE